jgi:hypothetical protein
MLGYKARFQIILFRSSIRGVYKHTSSNILLTLRYVGNDPCVALCMRPGARSLLHPRYQPKGTPASLRKSCHYVKSTPYLEPPTSVDLEPPVAWHGNKTLLPALRENSKKATTFLSSTGKLLHPLPSHPFGDYNKTSTTTHRILHHLQILVRPVRTFLSYESVIPIP